MVPDCEKGESVGLEPAASNHGRLRVQCADASCARWRTAGPLHCWRTVRCLKHQAQGASDGRRARRLAESEPEPLEAHLVVRCTTARAGWSWRAASCQSRRSAARPAASGEESAAAPRRCHRTSGAATQVACARHLSANRWWARWVQGTTSGRADDLGARFESSNNSVRGRQDAEL